MIKFGRKWMRGVRGEERGESEFYQENRKDRMNRIFSMETRIQNDFAGKSLWMCLAAA